MTKMNSFMNDSDVDDEQYFEEDTDNIFQPDNTFSPFDQGISELFWKCPEGNGQDTHRLGNSRIGQNKLVQGTQNSSDLLTYVT